MHLAESNAPWSDEIWRMKRPRPRWVGEAAHKKVKIFFTYYSVSGKPVYHRVQAVNADGSPSPWERHSRMSHETLIRSYATIPRVKCEQEDQVQVSMRMDLKVLVVITYGPDGKYAKARVSGGHYRAIKDACPGTLEEALKQGAHRWNDGTL